MSGRRWPVGVGGAAAIIGAGNIGRALLPYNRFQRKGFDIVAIFDADPDVVGRQVAGHRVRPLADLAKLVVEREVKIAILAVPADHAQSAAEQLIDAGVVGILNFAPVRLEVGDRASVVSVDLSRSLEQLAFQVSLGMTGASDDET